MVEKDIINNIDSLFNRFLIFLDKESMENQDIKVLMEYVIEKYDFFKVNKYKRFNTNDFVISSIGIAISRYSREFGWSSYHYETIDYYVSAIFQEIEKLNQLN